MVWGQSAINDFATCGRDFFQMVWVFWVVFVKMTDKKREMTDDDRTKENVLTVQSVQQPTNYRHYLCSSSACACLRPVAYRTVPVVFYVACLA
jgi:hypothetical protein